MIDTNQDSNFNEAAHELARTCGVSADAANRSLEKIVISFSLPSEEISRLNDTVKKIQLRLHDHKMGTDPLSLMSFWQPYVDFWCVIKRRIDRIRWAKVLRLIIY